MANFGYLCHSPQNTPSILFSRFIILALSTAALGLSAAAQNLYSTQVAPTTSSFEGLHKDIVSTNAVSILASAASMLWCMVLLGLLARRMLHTYRRANTPGVAKRQQTCGGASDRLLHPGWEAGVDLLCGALLVVASTLIGVKNAQWNRGLHNGLQFDKAACPTFDPKTGLLDYWCLHTWNQVISMRFNAQNVMAPTAGVHFTRVFAGCYYLYRLRRSYRADSDGLDNNPPTEEDRTAILPHQAKEIELARMERINSRMS